MAPSRPGLILLATPASSRQDRSLETAPQRHAA
jgi:hypothetical protein